MTKTRTYLGSLVLIVATAAITTQVISQTNRGADAYEKYAVPDQNHEVLEKLIGNWSQELTIWAEPGAEPAKAQATAEYRWILGGRFVIGTYLAYEPGSVFKAKDIVGYDRFRGQYNSLWVDNKSTQFTVASGHYNTRTKTLTLEGVQDDVELDIRDMPFKLSYRFVNADEIVMEMRKTTAEGKMFKSAQLRATRTD